MNATDTIPTTRNESWGFWNTMQEQAQDAWPLAIRAISEATGESLESVRIFLDSRHGRHFADDVRGEMTHGLNLLGAIAKATARWMDWRINRETSKDYGIPRGLPYLTGMVIACEIAEELAD